MASTAVDVVVTGHVQGVFYRASMRERAEQLGVRGWVRNEWDGSVRAHLEGDADAVEALVEWCSHGPPAAVVDDVQRTASEPTGAQAFGAG
jgi:acylphosphatase